MSKEKSECIMMPDIFEYEVGDYEILVNPVVSQEYRVYSKANLLFKSNSYASAPPFGYINEMKYYGGGSSFSTDILEGDSSDKHFHAHYPIKRMIYLSIFM